MTPALTNNSKVSKQRLYKIPILKLCKTPTVGVTGLKQVCQQGEFIHANSLGKSNCVPWAADSSVLWSDRKRSHFPCFLSSTSNLQSLYTVCLFLESSFLHLQSWSEVLRIQFCLPFQNLSISFLLISFIF